MEYIVGGVAVLWIIWLVRYASEEDIQDIRDIAVFGFSRRWFK